MTCVGLVAPNRPLLFAVLFGIAALGSPGQQDRGKSPLDTRLVVRSIRVDQLLREPPGWGAIKSHETEALAFSPDDARLAITLTHHQFVAAHDVLFNTHLLVLDVHSPESAARQFDLSGTCGVDLSWNESGNALLFCGILLRLTDGANCVVSAPPRPSVSREYAPYKAFWLDSEHVVKRDGEILDMSCRHVGDWPLEKGWRIGAVAVSKGWIHLWRSEGHYPNTVCEFSIVDRASHTVLSGWPIRESPCGRRTMLAVGAEAVCSSVGGENITNGELQCRTANDGIPIPVPRQLRDYVLIQGAARSARVIADEWKYERFAVDSPPLPRMRAIFDVRSGTVICSWRPGIQQSRSPLVDDWPYRCTLSTTGELMAESGDGSLDLYSLAPFHTP